MKSAWRGRNGGGGQGEEEEGEEEGAAKKKGSLNQGIGREK